MSKSFREDLTGKRFGRLTVLEFVPIDNKRNRDSFWKCICDCGNIKIVCGSKLKNGTIKSCGCIRKEQAPENGKSSAKHNKSRTRLYRIWDRMKERCYSPRCKIYKNYGDRGISVCDEWRNDFMAFYYWAMKNGYRDDLSIDRIDVNGNYEASNCRWVDMKTQANNRRNNIIVEYEGERITLAEAAEKVGMNYYTLFDRYARGDRGERLFRPV